MKRSVVTCPRCGAEYLPQEIFIPNAFFGRASHIERDESTHKIIEVQGTELDPKEEYTCRFCNTPFNVTAKISFKAEEDKKRNFDEDYSTSLVSDTFILDEE